MIIKNLKYIHEFVILADICNYARAAEELFTSQSTLSKHIKALEDELGQALFERSTRSVRLTQFGADFLPYANTLLQALSDCESFLTERRGSDGRSINLGVLRSLNHYSEISDCLEHFITERSSCKLNIIQDNHNHLKEKLHRNECDLIIVRESPGYETGSYERITILKEPLCIMLPADHPLAGKDEISLTDLSAETFILPPEGTLLYDLFVNECEKLGFTPNVGYRVGYKEYSSQLVGRHKGLAVLAKSVAEHYCDETLAVAVIYPRLIENINVVYPKFSQMPKDLRSLLRYFRRSFYIHDSGGSPPLDEA